MNRGFGYRDGSSTLVTVDEVPFFVVQLGGSKPFVLCGVGKSPLPHQSPFFLFNYFAEKWIPA